MVFSSDEVLTFMMGTVPKKKRRTGHMHNASCANGRVTTPQLTSPFHVLHCVYAATMFHFLPCGHVPCPHFLTAAEQKWFLVQYSFSIFCPLRRLFWRIINQNTSEIIDAVMTENAGLTEVYRGGDAVVECVHFPFLLPTYTKSTQNI